MLGVGRGHWGGAGDTLGGTPLKGALDPEKPELLKFILLPNLLLCVLPAELSQYLPAWLTPSQPRQNHVLPSLQGPELSARIVLARIKGQFCFFLADLHLGVEP